MPRKLCQGVLLGALLPLASACFLSHGDDDPPVRGEDAGPPTTDDAGRPRPTADAGPTPGWDAGPPRWDAGPPPDDCFTDPFPARIDRACVPGDSGFAPVGSPFHLEVAVDGCFCEGAVYCDARIAEPGVLALRTSQCPDAADCDECIPTLTASCAIPPLAEGRWEVRVNGAPGFDLEARPGAPGLVGRRVCYDVAPVVEGSLVCPWPGGFSASSTEVCHPTESRPGVPIAIRVADTCASCFDVEGSCEVSVSLNDIVVAPTTRSCDCPVCGACAEVCQRQEVTCHTPPLEPGTYSVHTPAGATTLVVTPTASYSPPEICAGSASAPGTG